MIHCQKLVIAALAILTCAASSLAQAQGKPIRLIVPYAAGGPLDVTARVLAERVRAGGLMHLCVFPSRRDIASASCAD